MKNLKGTNWANVITYTRFVLAPLFLVVFFVWPQGLIPIWILFLLGEATDILDGVVARKWGFTSELGKVLDPFADVYSRLTLFLAFLLVDLFPLWAFALVFYREISMIFLRLLSVMQGRVVGASKGGKIKAWLYFLVSLTALARYSFNLYGWQDSWNDLWFWGYGSLVVLTVSISLGTFIDYVRKYLKTQRKREE